MAYEDFINTPRLYVDSEMDVAAAITLDKAQSHYLANVMRCAVEDRVRVFNGRVTGNSVGEDSTSANKAREDKGGEDKGGGHNMRREYGAVVVQSSKREVVLEIRDMLREEAPEKRARHLVFAPIKKHRMDFMIEKATELGVAELHPVITQHCEIRKINHERVQAQLIEAAEQCERLDIPVLHPVCTLEGFLSRWAERGKIAACLERGDYPHIKQVAPDMDAVLIGPEGGFSGCESSMLASRDIVIPVSLGRRILRAETAALYALGIWDAAQL